jgi:hypothetical protein
MTAIATAERAKLEEYGWLLFVRQLHRHFNSRHFSGQLSEPTIEFVAMEAGTNGNYGHRNGEPIIRFARATIDGIPYLGSAYASTLRRARLGETLKHEMAHQAADQLHGQPPTGDQDIDHSAFGFRLACVDLGIPISCCSPDWLYL